MYAASVFNATSDATLKTNISPIENPLGILEKITGVSFDWRDNEGSAEGVLALPRCRTNLLPNAVSTDEKGKKQCYNNLVGVLIEAVKGQQEQINKLKDKLNNFQVNGVEWINSSWAFYPGTGLKTAQNTAMTGTGSMTTNTATDWSFWNYS